MRRTIRRRPGVTRRIACAGALLTGLVLLAVSAVNGAGGAPVILADVDGPIGPATARHVQVVLERAAQRGAPLVVLRMDTPGGLSDSMRDIIKAILASPVPVATWVAPAGARAASAGTYIFYASHVAAMSPGTNLGAATPVRIGGGGLPTPGERPDRPGEDAPAPAAEETDPSAAPAPGDAMTRKTVNDAAAYLRSLAALRGRNAGWAERAVREGASLTASEAREQGVSDLTVADLAALLEAVDGRRVDVRGEDVVLRTAGRAVETLEPSWQLRVLAILTNPNVAFVLMMIGIYGLIFEFSNPGSIGPGVIGVICLLLGLYALNLLPLDHTGLALLLLGVAFMVAEAFLPSFGVLGIGGLVAFALGASILLDSDTPHFRLAWEVIAVTTIASAALLAVVLSFALRSQRRPVTTGAAEVLQAPATVLEWDGTDGFVRARGERWAARSGAPLAPGTQVRVTAVEGLTLLVSDDRNESTGDET